MSSTKHINLDFLREISDGNDNFFKEFIGLFLNSAPQAISDMEQSYFDKNWDTLSKVAHKIKPSFNYIGLKDLNRCAAKIEELANNKSDTLEIQMMIDNIKTVCKVAYTELEIEIKNGLA